MLDIRATAYISPVAEVEFASVPLTVRIANVADETGLITGTFRIYNSNTGTLIHTSEIVPFSLAPGLTHDASALTDFDPPAPADDRYFVLFDGLATNALVPDGIGIHLGQFYFDVKPVGMGPAPAGHHLTHELGGSDEIDCTGLPGAGGGGGSGLSETPQTLTDGAAIDWDLALGGAATITLGGDRTMNEADNMVDGMHASLRVIQDGTGTRLLTWDATYRFPGGVAPALTAAINAEDILLFVCDGTHLDCVGMVSALA